MPEHTGEPMVLMRSAAAYVDSPIARALEAGNVGRTSQVLEIGAGLGRYTLPMAEDLDGLSVLELSPGTLADLSARAPESLRASLAACDQAAGRSS